MAELTDQQKEQIVLALATFRAPSEVAAMMREDWQLDLDLVQIIRYDPTKPAYAAGDKWRPIFDEARKLYIEEVSTVPIANQGYRLQTLQRALEAAAKQKNWKLVAELTEQASKEVGGVFTNARDLNINDSRDRARNLTEEERRELLLSRVNEVAAGKKATDSPHPTPQ